MKIISILQARMGSTRLPGKILCPLMGLPVLAVLRGRTNGAPIDEEWLATTENPEDDVTAAWGEALGYKVFRGSNQDVLSRFTRIARDTEADWIVRMTGDNPLVDRELLRLAAADAARALREVDLLRYPAQPSLPLGYGVSVVRGAALLEAESRIGPDEDYHRAHVTSWVQAHGTCGELSVPSDWPSRPNYRWTIDTPEDLRMMGELFRRLGMQWAEASYPEIVRLLDGAPELHAINRHVHQKELKRG